jgi:hypothetical protein
MNYLTRIRYCSDSHERGEPYFLPALQIKVAIGLTRLDLNRFGWHGVKEHPYAMQ